MRISSCLYKHHYHHHQILREPYHHNRRRRCCCCCSCSCCCSCCLDKLKPRMLFLVVPASLRPLVSTINVAVHIGHSRMHRKRDALKRVVNVCLVTCIVAPTGYGQSLYSLSHGYRMNSPDNKKHSESR